MTSSLSLSLSLSNKPRTNRSLSLLFLTLPRLTQKMSRSKASPTLSSFVDETGLWDAGNGLRRGEDVERVQVAGLAEDLAAE
ncbi:unnamed protein product [Linum trigynum]|uniref:Uncharacterized protein n=1 Tax=Linum trigynum TaxID=586398 RepID=A0AAV2GSE1_9ROSI